MKSRKNVSCTFSRLNYLKNASFSEVEMRQTRLKHVNKGGFFEKIVIFPKTQVKNKIVIASKAAVNDFLTNLCLVSSRPVSYHQCPYDYGSKITIFSSLLATDRKLIVIQPSRLASTSSLFMFFHPSFHHLMS